MPTFLLLGTATEAGRQIIVRDTSWVERHISTIKANHAALEQFFFTLGDVAAIFVVAAQDAAAADRAAVALSAHGLLRMQVQRGYAVDEYQALIAPPAPPVEQLASLAALQSKAKRLVEHHTDSRTTHLDDYATAIVRTGGEPSDDPAADLVIGGGDEATLKFAENISAIGLTYQQGLFNAQFELQMADGSTATYEGAGFFPAQSFIGFVAQQPISGMVICTRGSFYLEDFYFFADRRFEPAPAPLPEAVGASR